MKNKKLSPPALLTAAALIFSAVGMSQPVSADAGTYSIPALRRAIDKDIAGEELGTVEGSGYVFKESIYSYLANYYTNAYAVSSPAYNGNALRIGYLNRNGDALPELIYTAILNTVATAHCADPDTTALQLMYNPKKQRESTYIGITCRTKSGKAALMIRLNDYIELNGTDYSKNEWIKITIPINYFFENGEFNTLGGTDTSFRRQSINGAVFAYSTEGLTVPQTSSVELAYIDDVRFVSVPQEPQNLKYCKTGSSVTLSWNGLDVNTAEKFEVYRNGTLIAEPEGAASYTDTSVDGANKYIYSVCSVSDTGERSAASHIEVDMTSPDSGNYTETEKHILYSVTDRSAIDDALPVMINWNRFSTATQASITYLGSTLAYFAAGNSPLHQRQAAQNAVTLPDTDRYRILPITTIKKTDSGVTVGSNPKTDTVFGDALTDFGDYEIVFDAAKGKGYDGNISGIKIGLAYVDYNTTTSYTTSTGGTQVLYATGIKWYDVSSKVALLPAYSDSNTWNTAHGKLAVKVSDILDNGSEKYLHGAEASTHAVTVDNANAIVFDIVTKTADYKSSSPVMLINELSAEKTTDSGIGGGTGEIDIDIKLCDKNGKVYNNTTTAGAYPDRIKITTENGTGSAETVKLIVAMYDGNERFIGLKTFDAAIPLGKAERTIYPGFYQELPGSYMLKFFVLKDLEELEPVTDAVQSGYTVSAGSTYGSVNVLNTEYQTITGWGISPFQVADKDFKSFSNYEDWPEIYKKTYGDLGITSVRVPIDAACGYTEEPSDPAEPNTSELGYIVKYIERAKDFGIDDWIICFWDPPAYMEGTEYISDRGADLHVLKDEYKDDYCRYIVNILDYLKSAGVGTPKGLCFQNEPQAGNNTPFYTTDKYKYVAKKLRTLLDENGYGDVLIEGPETVSYWSCFRYTGGSNASASGGGGFNYNNFRKDADYKNAIGIISMHTYTESNSRDADITKFASEVSDVFPDHERWMTEYSGLGAECTVGGTTDYVMGPALSTMRVLSSDIGWGGMNRWYYWRAFTTHYNPDENGASYDVLNDKYSQQAILYGQTGGKVVKSKLYDCLSLLFNNVPVGSKVRRAETTVPGLVNESALKTDVLSFETEKGTVVMLVNISELSGSIDFSGLTGSKAEIYSVAGGCDDIITSSAEINSGTAAAVHIPPRSVTFVVTE